MQKVLITTSTFGLENPKPLQLCREHFDTVINPFGRKLTRSELLELAVSATGIVAGTEGYDRDVILRLKELRVISRVGVGIENIDVDMAQERGVKIYNTPDVPTQAVAELTVALMLDLLRKVTRSDSNIRRGLWREEPGSLLSGKLVGIVGFGRIGRRVSELTHSFGARVAFFDVNQDVRRTHFEFLPLVDLLTQADVVTLHCSGSEPLLSHKELCSLKPGAILINTARGQLVNEDAVVKALMSGPLAGAAFDVFHEEPYTGPLCQLDNVILTPHIGAYARECRIEMELQAVQNLIAGLML